MSANNPTENKASQEENKQLIPAVCAGNVDKVSFLIGRGVNINYLDSVSKKAPLHWAAQKESVECITALLNAGADINITDEKGDTPLHIATVQGRPKIMNVLITAGAGINTKGCYGETPLHWAARTESVECITALLNAGADINITDERGDTPLHIATVQGRPKIMSVLITAGVGINTRGCYGETPLHRAAQTESVECITALLDAGADINITDERGDTPLHIAAAQGRPNIMSVLITAGAGINTKGCYGETPLHWAARNRRLEVCALLIARGADIHAMTNHGRSCFEMAPSNFKETLLQIDAFIKASACWNIWEMPETQYQSFLQWIPEEVLQDILSLITTVPEPLCLKLSALFNEYPEIFAPKEQRQEIIPAMPSSSLSQNPNLFYSSSLNPELQAQNLMMAVSQELILQYPDLVSTRMRK